MKDSLKNVCDRYGINFSSAKNVIQIFKKEGRLEKKIIKARKQGGGAKSTRNGGDSEASGGDYGDEGLEDEGGSDIDEDGFGIVTLAPEEQRCKLNLFIQTLDDEETRFQAPSSGKDVIKESPSITECQSMVSGLNQEPSSKHEVFSLKAADFGSAANMNEQEKATL